ncbi:gas vesicle accessory protein GvpU [Halalkalibacter oceani]|uniref:gas vesicle accessory protein GvpU n=1 Tax=Halalkalibacter oceani TaxID=1653776 RepID=UPI0033939C0F
MSASNDNILEYFVQAANKHDFALDITLNVGGAIVSGTMVSAKHYFSTMSETFAGGNEISHHLSDQLAQAGEAAKKSEEPSASFIHLKEAKVYCGDSNPTPSEGEVLWRGKLSEIDGFYLGKITGGETPSSDQEKTEGSSSSNKLNDRLDQLEESIKGLLGNDNEGKEEADSEEETSDDSEGEGKEEEPDTEEETSEESEDKSNTSKAKRSSSTKSSKSSRGRKA